MKVTRVSTPPVAQSPDTIMIELTLAEAEKLKYVAGYDETVPNAIYRSDTPTRHKDRVALGQFLTKLSNALYYGFQGKPVPGERP